MSEPVSVVVPTFQRPEALRLTLDALIAIDYPPDRYEVIVVDDGGDADTARLVRELSGLGRTVRYVTQANSGAASARNHGARVSEGSVLIFCDDDAIVEPSHIRLHLKTRSEYEDPLVSGVSDFYRPSRVALEATPFGRYRIDLEQRFEAEADARDLGDGRAAADFLSARNLAVGRDTFLRLGAFDESFPYAGAEDQDLSYRAKSAGCTLVRDHGIRVHNNEPIATLAQFCRREERSAHTIVVLARKHPDAAGRPIVRENAPVGEDDPWRTRAKKVVKGVLSRPMPLAVLGAVVTLSDRVPLTERLRRRLYSFLVGLHIFKGVRSAS